MHYRSASPAGREAVAIVHSPTVVVGGDCIQRRARPPSVKTKDDNGSKRFLARPRGDPPRGHQEVGTSNLRGARGDGHSEENVVGLS